MRRRAAVASASACLAFACSDPGALGREEADGGVAGASGAAGTSGAVDAGDVLEARGSFVLELVPTAPATADAPEKAAYTKLLGQALDGETPNPLRWTLAAEEGDCQLFEPSVPFCDPKCTGGAVCVDDDVCAAYPRGLDLGVVTLRGVRTQDGGDSVVLKPVAPSYSYQLPGSMLLAFPPFAAGDEVTIDTEGGELSAFTIRASGVDPLQLMAEGEVELTREAATELRWDASATPGARIEVIVDISHHGGQKGEIRCASDDDGSLDIPQALGAQLVELGVAGHPTLEVERYSAGSTAVGRGSVALRVSSPVTLGVRIPGLVSCDAPGVQDVCPAGQLCQPEHLCR